MWLSIEVNTRTNTDWSAKALHLWKPIILCTVASHANMLAWWLWACSCLRACVRVDLRWFKVSSGIWTLSLLPSDFPSSPSTALPVEGGLELLLSLSIKPGCFQQEINVCVKESAASRSAGLLADSLVIKVLLSHRSCGCEALQRQVWSPPSAIFQIALLVPAGVAQVALTSFPRMPYFSHYEQLWMELVQMRFLL